MLFEQPRLLQGSGSGRSEAAAGGVYAWRAEEKDRPMLIVLIHPDAGPLRKKRTGVQNLAV
jgi:hypothetical protein